MLYAKGETAARGADRFARRLTGPRGENMVHLAAQAVRAVALGVVVTAVVQSGLAGVGLAVAGVPFVSILTALMFMLAIAQVGRPRADRRSRFRGGRSRSAEPLPTLTRSSPRR